MTPTEAGRILADRWQRDFPLAERPFSIVGESAGLDEKTTIDVFAGLLEAGAISRIGAVVRPHTAGTSTLAAMRVPMADLESIAALVSEEPAVTHNYEREHEFNLWFVITGPDRGTISETIEHIARRTGLPVMDLPLLKAYHVDLGFPLDGENGKTRRVTARIPDYQPDLRDRSLLSALENGIPLVSRPYRDVGEGIAVPEREVIDRLAHLKAAGVVTRFGCVIRHRHFGYTANAMAVWDIPDEIVDNAAARISANRHVTLCYCRPRRLPDWPYNLFCMVHAKTRSEAKAVIDDVNAIASIGAFNHAVLFSTRCFKQRGALFSDPARRSN